MKKLLYIILMFLISINLYSTVTFNGEWKALFGAKKFSASFPTSEHGQSVFIQRLENYEKHAIRDLYLHIKEYENYYQLSLTWEGPETYWIVPKNTTETMFINHVDDVAYINLNADSEKPPKWTSNPIKKVVSKGMISVDLSSYISNPSEKPYTITSPILPTGFSITNNSLYGYVLNPQNFNFSLDVTNENGSDNTQVQLSVIEGQVTDEDGTTSDDALEEMTNVKKNDIHLDLYKGENVFRSLSSYFGDRTATFRASSLPSYLSLSKYGYLTGLVPYTEGQKTYTSNLDVIGKSVFTVKLIIRINGISSSNFYFTSPGAVYGTNGQNFSYKITTNKSAQSYNVSSLPSFLSFSGSTVSGVIPVGVKNFSFTVSATPLEGVSTINKKVYVRVSTKEQQEGTTGTGTEDKEEADNHVVVDNFDDISNTRFANDNKKGLEKIAGEVAGLRSQSAADNKLLGRIAENTESSSKSLDSIESLLGDLDLTGIKGSIDSQTEIMTDIRDVLKEEREVSKLGTEDYEFKIHTKKIEVTFLDKYTNKNYNKQAPIVNIPLSKLNSDFDDNSLDLSNSIYIDLIQLLRNFELGIIFILFLHAVFKLIRSFEY